VLPIDGLSLLPLFDGEMKQRPRPIGFFHHGQTSLEDGYVAWNDNQYKLHRRGADKYELYDLTNDLSETTDLADKLPEVTARMKKEMQAWLKSVYDSREGLDYPEKKVLEPDKAK